MMPGGAALRAALWAAALLAAATATAQKKRAAPPPPVNVTAGGVRYATARGADQAGTIIASDAATGAALWQVALYPTRTDPALEADKQDVFITRLRLADRRRALIATDERGRRWRLELATRTVTPLPR